MHAGLMAAALPFPGRGGGRCWGRSRRCPVRSCTADSPRWPTPRRRRAAPDVADARRDARGGEQPPGHGAGDPRRRRVPRPPRQGRARELMFLRAVGFAPAAGTTAAPTGAASAAAGAACSPRRAAALAALRARVARRTSEAVSAAWPCRPAASPCAPPPRRLPRQHGWQRARARTP